MSPRVRPPREDPAVAQVEQLLVEVASSSEPIRRDGRVVTTHAVWLCACESFDDAPTWLVYATADGGVGWERVAEGLGFDIPDVVQAEHLTGCHPSPDGVLAWLRGEQDRPWRGPWVGDFPEDDEIYEEISSRIRSASS